MVMRLQDYLIVSPLDDFGCQHHAGGDGGFWPRLIVHGKSAFIVPCCACHACLSARAGFSLAV